MAQLGIQDLHAMTRSEEPVNLLQLVDAVSDCVPAIGTDGFIEQFLLLVSKARAVQVTAFAYSPTKAECLLSRNFLSEAKGGALAAAYLDGWFRNDPVFDRLIAMNGNQCIVERLEDMLPAIDVNRRANGTPYRRAKGTPFHDGARLIGHAPLRCARRREGGARPEARAAQSIF